MPEYIEREATLYRVKVDVAPPFKVVAKMPAANVAPVRYARWDENGRCTACGGHAPFYEMSTSYYKSPFCFECGADMTDGAEKQYDRSGYDAIDDPEWKKRMMQKFVERR